MVKQPKCEADDSTQSNVTRLHGVGFTDARPHTSYFHYLNTLSLIRTRDSGQAQNMGHKISKTSGRLIGLKLPFSAVDRLIHSGPSFSSKIAESHLIIGR
jgi:hypothetical protein